MMQEMEERLSNLEKILHRLIRVGVVTQVYPEKGTVRVEIADLDDVISYELPVLFRKTCKDKDYWMPDVGEHVVCVFLPTGAEQGFVIGAFYSHKDKTPVADQEIRRIEFSNGAFVEHDRKTGNMRINTPGDIKIEAAKTIKINSAIQVRIVAPDLILKAQDGGAFASMEGNFVLKGNLEVEGNIHATGSIIDEGGNTNHHSH